LKGGPRHVAYSASKGGIAAMTRTLAVDHAHENIRVNAVCPGSVETPLFEKVLIDSGDYDAARRKSAAKHPMGRIGTPEEIADVIVFLCGPGARFITGQSISVDGGRNIF
jgi:NAD(P)-dependent dehydrogenase (short-subunit alcohol dehydrogenase family)